jgi:hypothetical protein
MGSIGPNGLHGAIVPRGHGPTGPGPSGLGLAPGPFAMGGRPEQKHALEKSVEIYTYNSLFIALAYIV